MSYAQDRLAELRSRNAAEFAARQAMSQQIALQALERERTLAERPPWSPAAKLTPDQVRSIRTMATAGFVAFEIREQLDLQVVVATVQHVISRRTWRHV
jgi:hypothetical protein